MSFPAAEEATRAAVDYAGQAGVLRSFDPNLRLPLWDSPADAREKIEFGLRHCDILKISDDEIEFVTGERDAEKGLVRLRTRCDAGLVCVTMGQGLVSRPLGCARRLFRRSGRRYHGRRRYVHRLSAGRRADARDKRL